MGFFSRRPKHEPSRVPAEPADQTADAASAALDEFDGRPLTAPLTDAERERIEAGLESLAARGVDVDDLDAIGAAYDLAFAEAHAGGGDSATVVETFGIAIGEYLTRHSARAWAVVTDVFGTDLGVVAARADTVVVPHNLVSARWMRGETGWVPAVVRHLVGLHPRA